MKKIGEFWIPDVDALPGRNLECSIAGFDEGQGIQIDHLRRALELVPRRKVAVDGGANVGAWARLMARHFEAVVSFEPNPTVYPCLARNVEEWGIADRVKTYPNGISDRSERVGIVTKGTGRTCVDAPVNASIIFPSVSMWSGGVRSTPSFLSRPFQK